MKKMLLLTSLFAVFYANAQTQSNNSTVYNSKFPLYSYYEYSWSASMYNKSEVAQNEIGSITLFLKDAVATTLENCEIYLVSTDNSTNELANINNAIRVFSGNISIDNKNTFTVNFTTPFTFNNENLIVYFVNNSNKAVYPMPEYVSKQSAEKSTIYNYSVFANNTAEVLESDSKPVIAFNAGTTSNILSNSGQDVSIFPNPVSNELNIENVDGTVSIYSSTGNLVFTAKNSTKIDVSNYSKGIYFIEYTKHNVLVKMQFIKE